MKTSQMKRVLAAALSATMVLTSLTVPAFALGGGETITGQEETIRVTSQTASARETNFNSGWKFYLGTSNTAQNVNFDDSGWNSVILPHDFSISQGFTTSGEAESGFLPGGTGWYRKSFTLPAADKGRTIVLNFDGVYSDAYVYVNGTYVGENHYGYTSFAFDITDYVTCDGVTENVIAVKAVNTIPSSRWYSGSGIYRDVTLIVTNPVHVAYNGTYVTTPNISSGNGTVNVEVEVANDGASAANVTVTNTVVETGDTASISVTVGAEATVIATASPVVSNPRLWSVDSPNLYTIRTELSVDGSVVDSYDTTFGFRWYSFDSNTGFYLNGQALKLNGVCMHHDQGAAGSAAYYDAIYRQLSIMKDMGVNAIRTSHNPADEDFIDICDELGLLVMEEAFDGWSAAKNGNSNDFSKYFSTNLSSSNNIYGGDSFMTWAEFAIKSVVKRDRNDPSVIMWSLGNEITEGTTGGTSSYPAIAQNLITWVQELDTTRPTTIGDNQRPTNSTSTILGQVLKIIQDNGGVVGFNYASSSELSSLHSAWGVLYSAETSSAVNSRGVYSTQANASASDYHLTSYDTSIVSWGKTAHDSLWDTLTADYVAGEFVWTGFDYIGEPTPWNGTGTGSVSGAGAIPNSSYFGIVETTGFEKDTYYLYRSQWNQDETTLHLVTAWDSDNYMTTSSKTPVVIYSNAPIVKLYRNGTLIGTATRKVNTTSAGHTYYTYTTVSNNSSVCTAVSGSGSTSLYATFNVTYASGTLFAKAFEADGVTEIALSGNSGKDTVTTPGTVSKLDVVQNKSVVDADGQSLVYIEVEVQDANGNLDTAATNTINFTLTGNGVIVGVDNGNQATTAKYQQSSVLTSSTNAKIAAYAGKALVIVRSTEDAGSFTVNVTSSGLTGGSATVTTREVSDTSVSEGLTSYTMVRDYTVKVGTVPELQTTVTGTVDDDDREISGTIEWENVSGAIYNTPGDYTINGVLTFAGYESIDVTCKLHVIDDVIALQNVSAVTTPGTAPALPSIVSGVLADGTLSGEFTVDWESVSVSTFAEVDSIVTVSGTAAIFGTETLPVTCTVRVAEAVNTESTNIANQYLALTEDCTTTSDNLLSIVDGVTNNSSDTNARWTNYNNRNVSSTASVTFTWATAHLLSGVNLYFFTDSFSASLPSAVKFEYSLNGNDFTEVGYADVTPAAGFTKTEYVFDQVINPVALKITLTEQSGRCVGLTEAEIMTYAGKLEQNSSAALSSISVDGTAIDDFAADVLEYAATGTAESVIDAASDVNAGITVLPALDGVVYILTVSEDGSDARTYAVTLDGTAPCVHENTEVRNAKEATCTEEGYTGDIYCLDCGELVSSGEIIPAKGHITEIQNAKEATCTEEGYTGDEVCTVCGVTVETGSIIPAKGHTIEIQNAKEATCIEEGYTGDEVCTVCGEIVTVGSVIPKTDHSWDSGVVTKPATEEEEGVMTYTCTVCGETRTEIIEKLAPAKKVPSVSLSASAGDGGKITLTAQVEDFENLEDYYTITGHGFVYLTSIRLGAKSLTVNTAGRTRVNTTGYRDDGFYLYNITPISASTKYVARAYLTYLNENGKTVTVYSSPIYVSYSALA